MDFPSAKEIAEIGVRELVSTPGSRITPEVARTDATDANILINLSAAMVDEVVGQEIALESAVFLDSCKGQALDRYLWDRYRLKRPGATPALNSIFFTTTVPAVAGFTVLRGTQVQTPDGLVYAVSADTDYPAGVGGGTYLAVAARSVLAGSSQRTAATVANPLPLSILSTIAGAPDDLTASFRAASSSGADEMSDPEFRQLGRDFFANASLGTLGALEARAKRVNGVKTARAFESLSASGRPERFVVLVISDQFTETYAALSTVPPTYAAQSQLLALEVQNALVDTRGAGEAVLVTLGQVVLLPISLDLRFQAGANFGAAAVAARAAILNYTNSLRGGQTWSYSDASQVLRKVGGLSWSGREIVSPIGDVTCKPLQLVRTSLRLVAVNNVSPDQLLGGLNPDQLLLT